MSDFAAPDADQPTETGHLPEAGAEGLPAVDGGSPGLGAAEEAGDAQSRHQQDMEAGPSDGGARKGEMQGRSETGVAVPAKNGWKRGGDDGSSGSPAQAASVPPAPEEYNIDYRQPGGIEPYIDRQFRDFAHRNGISGDLAQKMVDFNSTLEAARWQDHRQQMEQWDRETRSLPGWHGRNYTRNMGIARRAMQTFGSQELADLVSSSGYGNHPEVVKAFYNVGKCLSEDSYVDSNRRTPRKKTIGEILYPNQPV